MPLKLRVRQMAEAKGYANARELADAAGISYNTAYGYWNDTSVNFNRHALGKICEALGVHVYALIDDDFTFTRPKVSPESVRATGRPGRKKHPR